MNKKLLRGVSLAASVAVSVGLFAGCNAPASPTTSPTTSPEVSPETSAEATPAPAALQPEEGAKLVIWDIDEDMPLMEAAIEKFKAKYPGVEFTTEPVAHVDAKGKLATDGPAGVGADVFLAPHDHTGELAKSGLILENDLFADEVKNNDFDAALKAVSYDGKVWGYPVSIETYGLFYNKDIVPTPAKTFEEIKDFAKTYNNVGENKYTLMWIVGDAYFNHAFLTSQGFQLFGPNGDDKNQLGLDSEAALKGMEAYASLKEVYPVVAQDGSGDAMNGMFNEKKAAYVITGPWAIQGYKDAGVNFGVTALPTFAGKHPQSFSGVRSEFVSAYTKYPNAAKLFANYLASEEIQTLRYEMRNLIPINKNAAQSEAVKANEYIVGILDQAQYAVPMPAIPEMGAVWGPLGTAYSAVWNGEADAATALKQADEQIKATFVQ